MHGVATEERFFRTVTIAFPGPPGGPGTRIVDALCEGHQPRGPAACGGDENSGGAQMAAPACGSEPDVATIAFFGPGPKEPEERK